MQNQFRIFLVFAFILMVGLSFNVSYAQAADNLILNQSVEDSDGSAPLHWQTDQWGNNKATFTYQDNGYNSSHSLYVKVANRQRGDAKWYFDPVAVEPDTDYIFTDYYKSNVRTRIVVMSLDEQNKETYTEVLPNAPIAKNWKKLTYVIHTSPTAKKITVLHLISRNGWLQTDDFSLTRKDLPVTDLIIPNSSLETVSASDPNLPENWEQSSWGVNSPVYEYPTTGHTGNRSVKLTMTNYQSGDAKWVYKPFALEHGKDYKFEVWYKTDTIPHAVVQYIKNDGTEDYFGMPDPQPNGTDWQLYSDVFSVPNDVKEVSVFLFLSNDGWLQTDDYTLEPYQYQGFDKGRVTLIFDDGFEKNIDTMLPVVDQYNFKVTNCYATQYVEGIPVQIANVQTFAQHGHETCSHTVTHPDLTTLTTDQLDYELAHSQSFLQGLTGGPVSSFTSPFGAYNASINEAIKKYYSSHRTTDEGFNSKDTLDSYRLKVQNMTASTTLTQFQGWVNKAKADKTWLILLYHVVDSSGIGEFDTYKTDFNQQMAWLSSSGITVERMDKALLETRAQLP